MSVSLDEALKKITALSGIKAAFVFDRYQMIVSRDVPNNYGNDILKRIANQLYQLVLLSGSNGVSTQEFRLVYDRYAILLRPLSPQLQLYLVTFMEKGVELASLRQPFNLAVLVLEKAFRRADEKEAAPEVSHMAELAEQTLRLSIEKDESFAGLTRHLCYDFLGKYGHDLVDEGIEEGLLVVPLRSELEMRKLANYILARVVHPLKKQILQESFEDFIRSSLKV